MQPLLFVLTIKGLLILSSCSDVQRDKQSPSIVADTPNQPPPPQGIESSIDHPMDEQIQWEQCLLQSKVAGNAEVVLDYLTAYFTIFASATGYPEEEAHEEVLTDTLNVELFYQHFPLLEGGAQQVGLRSVVELVNSVGKGELYKAQYTLRSQGNGGYEEVTNTVLIWRDEEHLLRVIFHELTAVGMTSFGDRNHHGQGRFDCVHTRHLSVKDSIVYVADWMDTSGSKGDAQCPGVEGLSNHRKSGQYYWKGDHLVRKSE
ncbi:MAG: hypothetical protein MUF42_01765 [Cytophagaceae bacterium]|jgi:hypothetical protein|nr:hypothetical protein [Cytophagaceae bacterium]